MTSQNIISSTELRKALGTFATGVTVVTAASKNGDLAGLTVNSFTSVSLSPPLVLWCIASSSESLSAFKSAEYFAVNILASDQRALSNHFATRQSDKFKSIQYSFGLGQAPLIDGCVSWLQCKLQEQYEAGDHWIMIGEVVDLKTTSGEGLIFNQSHYGVSLPLPDENNEAGVSDDIINSESDSYFSLLFQAIHSYQANFEKHQQEIIESDYEARVLVILEHYKETDMEVICNSFKIPKSEVQIIIGDLITRGLIATVTEPDRNTLKLTATGKEKTGRLLHLLRDHDEKINNMLGEDMYPQFRANLKKMIDWNY